MDINVKITPFILALSLFSAISVPASAASCTYKKAQDKLVEFNNMMQVYNRQFIAAMEKQNVPYVLLGHVTQGKICVDDEHYGFVNEMKDVFDNSLGNILDQ